MRFSMVAMDCCRVSPLRRTNSLGRSLRRKESLLVLVASQDGASSSSRSRTSPARSIGAPSIVISIVSAVSIESGSLRAIDL